MPISGNWQRGSWTSRWATQRSPPGARAAHQRLPRGGIGGRPDGDTGAAVAAIGLEHQLPRGSADVLAEVSPGAVGKRGRHGAEQARPGQVPAEEGAVLAAEVTPGERRDPPEPRQLFWSSSAAIEDTTRLVAKACRIGRTSTPSPSSRADPPRRSRGTRGRSPGPGRSPRRRRGGERRSAGSAWQTSTPKCSWT